MTSLKGRERENWEHKKREKVCSFSRMDASYIFGIKEKCFFDIRILKCDCYGVNFSFALFKFIAIKFKAIFKPPKYRRRQVTVLGYKIK